MTATEESDTDTNTGADTGTGDAIGGARRAAPAPGAASKPALRFDVFTLFPGMFAGPLDESIIQRARAAGLIEIRIHDIRTWTTDRHRTADDTPYGGGAGMVMTAPPILAGVEAVLAEDPARGAVPIVLLSAAGRPFDQATARAWAEARRIVLICGRYEGIDQRVADILGADERAIGDYVLTGGELPAMVVIDAVSRLVPGVIDAASIGEESHDAALLEYPHYTRPVSLQGHEVPPVLLSGHHAEIARWRREAAIRRTARRRPDLFRRAMLTEAERAMVAEEREEERLAVETDIATPRPRHPGREAPG